MPGRLSSSANANEVKSAPPPERIVCAALATAGWTAIVVQCYWGVVAATAKGTPVTFAVVNVLSYFTILTNVLVAAVLTTRALDLRRTSSALQTPAASTAILSYILVVCFVYEATLRKLWDPQGFHFVVDITLHYLVPIGFLFCWLLFVPRGKVSYRAVPSWIIYPAAYLIYTTVRGRCSGFFPYPFVDFPQIGWARWGWNVLLLLAAFLGIGCLLVALDRTLARVRIIRRPAVAR